MASGYKVESYKITTHHDAYKGAEPWDDMPAYDETKLRYRIVSTETGEVLDDAQGYGYKTAQKAHAAYAYKNRDKSKDAEKRQKEAHIRKWMEENKLFVDTMDQFAFEIAKGSWGPDEKFDANLVKRMIEENNVSVDFTAAEHLRVWRKRR